MTAQRKDVNLTWSVVKTCGLPYHTLAGNAELLMNHWQPPLLEREVRGVVNSSKHSKGDLCQVHKLAL